jgi:hypothetical protein
VATFAGIAAGGAGMTRTAAGAGSFTNLPGSATVSRVSSSIGSVFTRAFGRVDDAAGAGNNALATNRGAPLESLLRANMKGTNVSAFSTAQKAALGEARTSLTMRRAGFDELPARLPGNQGFDGVWIRRAPDGSLTNLVITESKFSSTGTLQLNNTATMGRQLSPTWIDANIQRMVGSADPAIVRSGMLLQANRNMIRVKAVVLNPQGVQRFSAH